MWAGRCIMVCVTGGGPDEILAQLDPEQREVATTLLGPVCVLAGAGTGKTRAITHRIAYGVRTGTYSPTAVLAVTFTARAAGEMRTRLRDLGVAGVQARTFHAAALRQLAYFLPQAEGRAVPRLIDHKAGVVANAASRLGIEVDRAQVRDLAAEIEWAKVNLLTPETYRGEAAKRGRPDAGGLDATATSRLMETYDAILGELDAMDFEDVLLIMAGLLQTRPDVAAEVRRQYRHFVVDEYQDVSPLAQLLLDLWLGERRELCVVGDPNQTIYSFTGATERFLLGFTRRYPQAPVIRLVRDYRSTPQVVALANALQRTWRRDASGLVAQRPSGPAARFTTYRDDEDEARGIARRIGELGAQGIPPGETAILFRTNVQSEQFEQALGEVGLPYLVRGGERFFSRAEVREALVLLRGAAVAASDAPVGEQVRGVLASIGWAEAPPAPRGQVRERWESLQALVMLADEMQARGLVQLREVLVELDERAAAQHAPSFGGVTLASLHAAKGLEWRAVFLAGLSDGLVPISLAESGDEIAEERRLLYVGITRAQEYLELSYATSRTASAKASRKVSRFLRTLWPQDDSRRSATSGQESIELDAAAAALLQALETWRTGAAQRLGRPTYSVLHDLTLTEIALRRPSTMAELARIGGIGPLKMEQFGADVLAIVAGRMTSSD